MEGGQILAPYTKQIIGMDISEKMVEIFNEKVFGIYTISARWHLY